MASIRYDRLDPQKHEFRLLTVLARNHVQPLTTSSSSFPMIADGEFYHHAAEVHCTLQTRSTDEVPSYVALSYVWGPETPSAILRIDGKPVRVRENLEVALRQIQRKDHSIVIWVDAVCINQEDATEKSDQIRVMCNIYENATDVLVWLGPAGDDSDLAFDHIMDIGSKAIEAGIQDISTIDMFNTSQPNAGDRVKQVRIALHELAKKEGLELFHPSLIPFSKRAYWTRVWVLQEFCIARRITMLCGSKTTSLRIFTAALSFIGFATWTLATRFTLEDFGDPRTKPLLQFVSLNPRSDAPNALIWARRSYRLESGLEKGSLYSLLKKTCFVQLTGNQLEASNPRDKIYGLLALASDSDRIGIVPDYQKTTTEVYTDVARTLLTNGWLQILTWCCQQKHIGGLPSWVPDFSSAIREPCGEDRGNGALFCASGSRSIPRNSFATTDQSLIGLLGTKVSTILELGTAWRPGVYTPFDTQGAQHLLSEVEEFCNSSSLFSNAPDILHACIGIGCADQEKSGDGRKRASHSMHAAYQSFKSEGWSMETEIYFSAMRLQHNRKPFLSEDGHVGLAPAEAKRGDGIYIILGSSVPHIFRSLPGGHFQLIGEAYVHGIMDGEWLNSDPAFAKMVIR